MPGVSADFLRDFYQARLSRDPARIAPFLDDDVFWATSGPVDIFHFCGERRGKEAVLDAMVRLVPSLLKVVGTEWEEMLIDGDRAATVSRVTAFAPGSDRVISYRQAQFFRFRDNKIFHYRAIMDSFDAAEQLLGHAIDLSQQVHDTDRTGTGDVIARMDAASAP